MFCLSVSTRLNRCHLGHQSSYHAIKKRQNSKHKSVIFPSRQYRKEEAKFSDRRIISDNENKQLENKKKKALLIFWRVVVKGAGLNLEVLNQKKIESLTLVDLERVFAIWQKLYKNKIDKLTSLDLIGRNLRELPDQIENLKNLEILMLDNNRLTSLNEKIGSLTQLKILTCCYNKIAFLPKTMKSLSNLEQLVAAKNQLSKLPDEIASLKGLELVVLSYNRFKNIPQELLQLKKLKYLHIDHNKIKITYFKLKQTEIKF